MKDVIRHARRATSLMGAHPSVTLLGMPRNNGRWNHARGLVALLHDWRAAGKSLSRVSYFASVKSVEVPNLSSMDASELSATLALFVQNGLIDVGGAEVAEFLDQFLEDTGLKWDSETRARLRGQPDYQELAHALLAGLRAWSDNDRKLPRDFESALGSRLRSFDPDTRDQVFARFYDIGTGPDTDWGRPDVEAYLQAVKRHLGR
jgi:hypothetical protein